MNELLDYLDELMLLVPRLESEIQQTAFIWPDLKAGEILQKEDIENHVFFIQDGIISSSFTVEGCECIFQLFGKYSFLFGESFIFPGLTGKYENTIRAYRHCKLVAFSPQHFERLMQICPDMDEIYYIAMREIVNFQSKYVWNAQKRNSYQLLRNFSENFPYLYKHTDPADLEEILSLPVGLIPRPS